MQKHMTARVAMMGLLLLTGSIPAPAMTGETAVNIDNFTFGPAEVTVGVGERITWTNRDDIPHTVTDAATPRAFKSGPLDTGDTFSFVFTAPGTYLYFCSLHPHMQARVVVK
jgi:plastocyanin